MMTLIQGKFDKSHCDNVNSNYDIMFNTIHRVAEKNNSSKTYKFNISKTKTYSVIMSINYRDKLFKTVKGTPQSSVMNST